MAPTEGSEAMPHFCTVCGLDVGPYEPRHEYIDEFDYGGVERSVGDFYHCPRCELDHVRVNLGATVELCPSCRGGAPPGAHFCPHCGASMRKRDAETTDRDRTKNPGAVDGIREGLNRDPHKPLPDRIDPRESNKSDGDEGNANDDNQRLALDVLEGRIAVSASSEVFAGDRLEILVAELEHTDARWLLDQLRRPDTELLGRAVISALLRPELRRELESWRDQVKPVFPLGLLTKRDVPHPPLLSGKLRQIGQDMDRELDGEDSSAREAVKQAVDHGLNTIRWLGRSAQNTAFQIETRPSLEPAELADIWDRAANLCAGTSAAATCGLVAKFWRSLPVDLVFHVFASSHIPFGQQRVCPSVAGPGGRFPQLVRYQMHVWPGDSTTPRPTGESVLVLIAPYHLPQRLHRSAEDTWIDSTDHAPYMRRLSYFASTPIEALAEKEIEALQAELSQFIDHWLCDPPYGVMPATIESSRAGNPGPSFTAGLEESVLTIIDQRLGTHLRDLADNTGIELAGRKPTSPYPFVMNHPKRDREPEGPPRGASSVELVDHLILWRLNAHFSPPDTELFGGYRPAIALANQRSNELEQLSSLACAVFSPASVRPGEWFRLQVLSFRGLDDGRRVHGFYGRSLADLDRQEQRDNPLQLHELYALLDRVREIDDAAENDQPPRLTLDLQLPGFELETHRRGVQAATMFEHIDFVVKAPEELEHGTCRGSLNVWLHGVVPIMVHEFAILVSPVSSPYLYLQPMHSRTVRSLYVSHAAADSERAVRWRERAFDVLVQSWRPENRGGRDFDAFQGPTRQDVQSRFPIDLGVDLRTDADWMQRLRTLVPSYDLVCRLGSPAADEDPWVIAECRAAVASRGPSNVIVIDVDEMQI